MNRWVWDLRQGGSVITGESLQYGEATGQFSELAALWATYRLDSVEVQFQPNQTGSGQMTGVLSAIQPAGETTIFDPQNALESLSRLRTVQLRSAIGATSRSFNFTSFLQSVVP